MKAGPSIETTRATQRARHVCSDPRNPNALLCAVLYFSPLHWAAIWCSGLCSVQCKVHSLQCTVYSAHCKSHNELETEFCNFLQWSMDYTALDFKLNALSLWFRQLWCNRLLTTPVHAGIEEHLVGMLKMPLTALLLKIMLCSLINELLSLISEAIHKKFYISKFQQKRYSPVNYLQ